MPKKIAICHYRVGGTDGVSLEIEKRRQILAKHGCEVKLIAGNRSSGANFIIEELEWDDGIVPIIKENGFQYFNCRDLADWELKSSINKLVKIIKDKLALIQEKEKFDAVLIHNIFSFGGHIAAAKAFAQWVEKFQIPTLATHHDFYWENKEYHEPRTGYLKNYMKKFMPPDTPNIGHAVINSLARKELKKRRDIESSITPDVFDFNQTAWQSDEFNSDFLKNFNINPQDLILLQATRIIPRKGIELAVDFTRELQRQMNRLRGKTLYNGKKISCGANAVLLLAGYAENEKHSYLYKLKAKIARLGIKAEFISSSIKSNREDSKNRKIYSLWDAYVYADLVTFPSFWEGWGNQFIEAVFAKKLAVVFEYPVFAEDIKTEGYAFISLGNTLLGGRPDRLRKIPPYRLSAAVEQSIDWLLDKNLRRKLNDNFNIGKKFHDYKILEKFLVKKLRLH